MLRKMLFTDEENVFLRLSNDLGVFFSNAINNITSIQVTLEASPLPQHERASMSFVRVLLTGRHRSIAQRILNVKKVLLPREKQVIFLILFFFDSSFLMQFLFSFFKFLFFLSCSAILPRKRPTTCASRLRSIFRRRSQLTRQKVCLKKKTITELFI